MTRFKTADGMGLHVRQWTPDSAPKGVVVLIHGYADHGARYGWVASHLTHAGVAVSALDLRGHGASPGERAFIASFDRLVDDVARFVEAVRDAFVGVPLFVMGHSMGGLVVALYAATRKPSVAGVILSSPLLKVSDGVSPFLQRISGIVGALLPRLPVLPLDTAAISRDPEAVQAYVADPLVYHGRIVARTGAEMTRAANRIQACMEDVTLPLLLLHGTADRLCDVNGSRQMHDRARSSDKTLKLFD
ncbi:MAG: lysophospholipase, partial [Candidatus Hydrogenedentes bacterium]|nr:lysophospholipase [Candidatus Hydrogenedentota bacterium]